ncbi:MAG: NTP transferase domain-containing protein [Thermoanaerobaculaceae bacterium]|nr:NTP transferase domain-containing protein [Thermoanaerobaculaceae bacterium]MDI9621020.1 NTP transferase domain-containing protein [Acidobacteriota bacterium]NLH12667.1 NTP transferase domain-containing protein [Holophagae bacterium]
MLSSAGMATTTLVVMAAGAGSRFGGPKQLVPIGPSGETLLEYTAFDALRSGVGRLVLVVRREAMEAFRASVGARIASRVDLELAPQEVADIPAGMTVPATRSKPWGTAHAVLAARHLVNGPFLLANGDDFYGAGAVAAVQRFLRERSEGWALATWPLVATLSPHGPVSRGVCTVGEDGVLLAIREHTGVAMRAGLVSHDGGTLGGREPVSMNLWGFRPDIFTMLEEGFGRFLAERGPDPAAEYQLPTEVEAVRRAGRATVWAVPAGETWFGLTHPSDLEAARGRIAALVAAGAYPASLWR